MLIILATNTSKDRTLELNISVSDRKNLSFKFVSPSARFYVEYLRCRSQGVGLQVPEFSLSISS